VYVCVCVCVFVCCLTHRFCGTVLCSTCLPWFSVLPKQYEVTTAVRVCDICHGILNAQPYTFSYGSTARNRPLNLAAESNEDMHRWIDALNMSLSLSKLKKIKVMCVCVCVCV